MFIFILSSISQTIKAVEENISELLLKAKSGDAKSREDILRKYKYYILSVTSKITGRFIHAKESDEFSIALSAFNEAIDAFVISKNSNFLKFAARTIKWRILDYLKKNRKYHHTLPFSYFEDKDHYSSEYFSNYIHARNQYLKEFADIESKDEILKYENELKKFNITLPDIIKSTPRHGDSKALCLKLAWMIVDNDELYKKLIKNRALPRNELIKLSGVHRRTIENNRNYIIGICLLLKSDLELAKTYLEYLQKQ